MKDQYVGDINDFRKYGLLRVLASELAEPAMVCWMRTPNDNRPDGLKLKYLDQGARWRHYDPDLFDRLKALSQQPDWRRTRSIEDAGILPCVRFHDDLVPDALVDRQEYMRNMLTKAKGCGLVFMDPDNGFEIKSKRPGSRGSCKFTWWTDVEQVWLAGHSVLVYQHFARKSRKEHVEELFRQIQSRFDQVEVVSFETSHVAFILCVQGRHLECVESGIARVQYKWGIQFRARHPRAEAV